MMQNDTPEEYALLEGLISISAALRSGSREIQSVWIREGKSDPSVRRLEQAGRAAKIPLHYVSSDEIDQQAGGKTHGGLIARVGPRRFVELDALLPEGRPPFIVMLDGIEDPFNFGQSVRSLWAAGCDGLVLRPRNWLSAAATVARASAGASETIPSAIAETAADACAFYREHGLQIACADEDPNATVSLYDADLTVPLFLLIGGEKRGVSRGIASAVDLRLRIPYGRSHAHALGTAAAAAVMAFEVFRQRTL